MTWYSEKMMPNLHKKSWMVSNEHPLQFLIKSNDPARDELKILCQAESEESKKKWLGILKRQLQTQMDFLRALQAPIAYHNRLAND